MAPNAPDDRSGNNPAGSSRHQEGGSESDRASASRGQNDDLDFGSFVTRSIRSSANRFKGDDGDEPRTSRFRGRGPSAPDTADDAQGTAPRSRSSRYWRDSVSESDLDGDEYPEESDHGRRYVPSSNDDYDDDEAYDEQPRRQMAMPAWLHHVTANEDGEQDRNKLILAILIGLLLLGLLIFGLTRLIPGDDNDPTPTPTPTQKTELTLPNQNSTPGPNDPGNNPLLPGEKKETSTPDVRQGGDNQLEPGDSGQPTPTPQG